MLVDVSVFVIADKLLEGTLNELEVTSGCYGNPSLPTLRSGDHQPVVKVRTCRKTERVILTHPPSEEVTSFLSK